MSIYTVNSINHNMHQILIIYLIIVIYLNDNEAITNGITSNVYNNMPHDTQCHIVKFQMWQIYIVQVH